MAVSIELTRKHYAMLRQYWHSRSAGMASHGTGIALDLTAAGFLEKLDSGGYLHLRITQAGIEALHAESQREKDRRRPHHDLAERLSAWLRQSGRMTWNNVEFTTGRIEGGVQAVRPDVFSISPSFSVGRINPAVHEVKVSRADFLADIAKPEKRAGYEAFSEVMYYAAPTGIIETADLPPGVGLVVEAEPGQFSVVVKPKRRAIDLQPRHYLNLILKPGVFNGSMAS